MTNYNNLNISFKDITYGVPQGSLIGQLLLLSCINNLKKSSNTLHPVMFADDLNNF